MKKHLQNTLFSLLLLTTFLSKAQNTMAIRVGTNVANYKFHYGSAVPTWQQLPTSPYAFVTVGALIEVLINKYAALQGEVNFVQKGFYAESGSIFGLSKDRLIVNWLDIPLLAKLRFGSREAMNGSLFFGPSLNYGLRIHIKSETTTSNGQVITTDTERTFENTYHSQGDWSLNVGGEIGYRRVFFEARYQIGMYNMTYRNSSGSSGTQAYNRSIALTFGYRLPFKL